MTDTTESPKRFRRWTWDEIVKDRENRPQWVVPGLISDGSTSITGASEAGKSMLCTALLYSLHTGRPFLGRKPVRAYRPAVFATDDRGHLEYQERLEKIGREGAPKEVRDNLAVYSVESLLKYNDLRDLREEVLLNGEDFVIIDNASQALDGDGNNGEDINRLFAGIRLFTHANIPVVIVNHQNQSGSGTLAQFNRGISGNSNWTRNVRHRLQLAKITSNGVDTHARRLIIGGNYSEPEEWTLTMPRGIGTPVYKVEQAGTPKPKQKRSPETLDKNAEVAEWIKANVPAESKLRQAEAAAKHFGLNKDTVYGKMKPGKPIDLLLRK